MLKPFEHYALQNPPSIYDEESGTALKMCARLAGKVNEAIKAFNELKQATGEDIAEQNAHIQEVLDNLGTAIQNTMEIIVANGTFDEMIDEYSQAKMVEIEKTLGKRIDYANIARDLITENWEVGTIGESGYLNPSTNRIRSGVFQAPTKGPLYLGVAESFQVRVYEYDTGVESSFIRVSDWIIGKRGVVVPYDVTGNFVRLVVGKVDGSAVDPSESGFCVFTKDVYPFKDVQDDVTRLKGVLASLGVARTTSADQGTKVNLASTRRFFLETPIPAKAHIKEIRVKSVAGNNTVRVQLWALAEPNRYAKRMALVHTIEKASVMSEVNGQSFPVNMVFDYPVWVSVWGENNCVVGYTSTVHNLLVTPDIAPESTEIDLSTAETFQGYHAGVVAHYDEFTVMRKSKRVLYVGEDCEFTEIQDALDYAREHCNTCVIRVGPGKYKRFSMIRALHEPYPWTGAPVYDISIIGDSREQCVVVDTSGDYNTPPAELLCNGSIENLSFYAYATDMRENNAEKGNYAAHIDAEPEYVEDGYKMAIRNCYFYSESGPAVGVGLHNMGHVTFENCEFESNILVSEGTDENGEIVWKAITDHGTVYAHASVAEGTDEVLRFINCLFTNPNYDGSWRTGASLIHGAGYGDITGELTVCSINSSGTWKASGPSGSSCYHYYQGTVNIITANGSNYGSLVK